MARTSLTVNGITLLDENLEEWTATPPPAINDLMRPTDPQPWMKPAMVTLVDALLNQRPIHVDVDTNPANPTHWAMRVH